MKRLFAAGMVASLLLLLFAIPASAAEMTGGCVLEVRSFEGTDATGNQIDEGRAAGIIAEGNVGSQSRPFKVSLDGSIDFFFSTAPVVFENNSWSIYAQGLPVPLLTGFDDNPRDVDETGVINLDDAAKNLPFRVVGTFFIHGDLFGNDGANHCHGEGYVEVLGDPVGTVPWDLAVALIVFAGLMLLVAVPYSRDWEVDQVGGERLHTGSIDS